MPAWAGRDEGTGSPDRTKEHEQGKKKASRISGVMLQVHVPPDETIRATMTYTLGQAAKATGKSKPTIQRAIKSGSISAAKADDGSYEIDPSELHRVFPPVTGASNAEQPLKQSVPHSDTCLLYTSRCV